MYWIEFEQPAGKKVPKQLLTLGISKKDGTVFLPALLAESERTVLMCAQYSPTIVSMFDGHPYVPAEWMAEEFPEIRDRCDFLTTIAKSESDRLGLFKAD
ncbi:TPA: hypothetical protein UMY79_002659 [Stenotrophomonas maltophilia]|nr:hypothetical protein [Stenotrophomonas maltophilia]